MFSLNNDDKINKLKLSKSDLFTIRNESDNKSFSKQSSIVMTEIETEKESPVIINSQDQSMRQVVECVDLCKIQMRDNIYKMIEKGNSLMELNKRSDELVVNIADLSRTSCNYNKAKRSWLSSKNVQKTIALVILLFFFIILLGMLIYVLYK